MEVEALSWLSLDRFSVQTYCQREAYLCRGIFSKTKSFEWSVNGTPICPPIPTAKTLIEPGLELSNNEIASL
jgi:hypothetical protein